MKYNFSFHFPGEWEPSVTQNNWEGYKQVIALQYYDQRTEDASQLKG